MGVFAGVKNVQQAQFNVRLGGTRRQCLGGQVEPVGVGDALGHIAVGVIALRHYRTRGIDGVAGAVKRVVHGTDALVVGCGGRVGYGARSPAGKGCGECRAQRDVAIFVIGEFDDIAHTIDGSGEPAIAVIDAAVNAVLSWRGLDQGQHGRLGKRQAQCVER